MTASLVDELTHRVRLAMCQIDLDFRYVWVNDAMCDLLGYRADEILGATFATLTHAADAELDEHLSRRLFSGEISHFNVRKRYHHKDGSTVVADLIATSIVDATGVATGGFATLVPVS